jgi:hypothetical protein
VIKGIFMKQRKSRGRPPKYVRDSDGKPIVGLSFDEANNRYFNTHWKSDGVQKEHFGSNEDEAGAIFLFRQWDAQRKGESFHPIPKTKTKKGG